MCGSFFGGNRLHHDSFKSLCCGGQPQTVVRIACLGRLNGRSSLHFSMKIHDRGCHLLFHVFFGCADGAVEPARAYLQAGRRVKACTRAGSQKGHSDKVRHCNPSRRVKVCILKRGGCGDVLACEGQPESCQEGKNKREFKS